MIRNLPVDAERLGLLAAGDATAAPEWAELADGSRRPTGNQAKDSESGQYIWLVDCLVTGGERAELINVQVVGDEPKIEPLQAVIFEGLVAAVSKSKKTGLIGMYWSATGVKGGSKRPSPAPAHVGS
jgi:hypothetical protein